MEMSSPALNLHYFYRNLAGERAERITGISVKFFALLFFIFRIIIYGWAVLLLCFILSTQELPIPINWYKMGISVALFLTGLALQLKWLRDIYRKAMRSIKRDRARVKGKKAK